MKQLGKIQFGKTEDAYDGFAQMLKDTIAAYRSEKVLDVGGGAQPMLPVDYIEENRIEYTLLDISEEELARAPMQYRKVVRDIASPDGVPGGSYDLVFSRFMAEHVRDSKQLHRNVFGLLKPGGVAIHFFPTLFALPFLVNMVFPERLAIWFLPKARREKGKFAAYYKWCVGPSQAAITRYEELGYEVLQYSGFFGHGYYDGIPFLREIHRRIGAFLLRHPLSVLTSFAWVILRRPESSQAATLMCDRAEGEAVQGGA